MDISHKYSKWYTPLAMSDKILAKKLIRKRRMESLKKNIAILTIATGKYEKYIEGFCASFNEFFLKNHTLTIFVFTDAVKRITKRDNVCLVPTKHREWPYSTLYRWQIFVENYLLFEDSDFIYFFDSDMMAVDEIIDDEILPIGTDRLVGVRHPGYINSVGPFESRIDSKAFVPERNREIYYQGCISGGKTDDYLKMILFLKKMTDLDFKTIGWPCFHDESFLNFYFNVVEKPMILPPSFAWPESIGSTLNIGDNKKILHLSKDHNFMRDIK